MAALTDNALFDRLIDYLHRWERRRRLRDTFLWVPRGVLAGLLLTAVLATVARLRPVLTNEEVGLTAATLALAGLFATLAGVWLPRRTILAQARFADTTLGLRERTSTAVEIAQGVLAVPVELGQQQLRDTLDAAAEADVNAALPLPFRLRDWLFLSLAAVLITAAVYLPNPQGEILSTRRGLAQEIEEQEDSLEALVEKIEANDALTEEQRETLTAPLTEALEELALGDLTREEAVAALSEAEAELRDLRASNDTGPLQSGLGEAAQPLAQNRAAEQLGGLLQTGNLRGAAAQAAALAAGLSELNTAEQAALAEALSAAAAALADVDGELAGEMAAAAEALRSGDVAAAQAALDAAAENLQQRAQQQAAAQQAGAAADQLAQGRQQVAQAGQPGAGTQPGQGSQPGQGEGGHPGQGAGQGSGNGQGSGSGVGTGGNGGTGAGGGVGGTGGETGHATNLYVPDFADLSDVAGEDVELPAECVANPAACGALVDERTTEFGDEASIVPYQRVYGEYRDAAYQALEDEYIPLGLKGYVRDYFSSLEP